MNNKINQQIKNLPQKPGVYLFQDKTGRILYVGKAIKLKNRVQSHFTKGNKYYKKEWLDSISKIDSIITSNEKEALLLENELIKKYQPRFNVQWKDDKSYFWTEITSDLWPKVKIVHKQSAISQKPLAINQFIGPFINGTELKQVLRSLRKIFPYRTCKNPYNKPCLQWHLGLCPAHLRQGYGRQAHKNSLSPNAYKQLLNTFSQILRLYAGEPIRIEAYDISNIQGSNATGSMIVFTGNKPQKSDYRKFKIKTVIGANDVAMIKEILKRRITHQEWPQPDLMLIDGGLAQLNAAYQSLTASGLSSIPIISLAKQKEEIYTIYSNKVLRLNSLPISLQLTFQSIRNEAHRFAISYYRKLHRKILIN